MYSLQLGLTWYWNHVQHLLLRGAVSSMCGMLIQGAGNASVVLSELDCMYVRTMRGFILVLEY